MTNTFHKHLQRDTIQRLVQIKTYFYWLLTPFVCPISLETNYG